MNLDFFLIATFHAVKAFLVEVLFEAYKYKHHIDINMSFHNVNVLKAEAPKILRPLLDPLD